MSDDIHHVHVFFGGQPTGKRHGRAGGRMFPHGAYGIWCRSLFCHIPVEGYASNALYFLIGE